MKNCRYRHQIKSFWHRFAQIFYIIFAVFIGIILGGKPKFAKDSVKLWKVHRNKKEEYRLIKFSSQ